MAYGDTVAMKFVMVEGGARDYAIYRGPSDWSDEEVQSHGDKVYEGNEAAIRREMTVKLSPEERMHWGELSFRL